MGVQRRSDLQFELFPEHTGLDDAVRAKLESIPVSALPVIATVKVSEAEYGVYAITRQGGVACRVAEEGNNDPVMTAMWTLTAVENARSQMAKAKLTPTLLSFTLSKAS